MGIFKGVPCMTMGISEHVTCNLAMLGYHRRQCTSDAARSHEGNTKRIYCLRFSSFGVSQGRIYALGVLIKALSKVAAVSKAHAMDEDVNWSPRANTSGNSPDSRRSRAPFTAIGCAKDGIHELQGAGFA